MRTTISWELTNYCTAGCTYCPTKFWGGEPPRELIDYLTATETLINNYKNMGRDIDWIFSGGEPLEMFDFPAVLKLCKEENGNIELSTNGGKLWLDWWAIEPHIDNLHLTYHYWQNPNLIKFIIQTFQGKNKKFDISVPIRHDYFDADISRADDLSQGFGIPVTKMPLYLEADSSIGFIRYTDAQLETLFGIEWVNQNIREKAPTTYAERVTERVLASPVYTGKLCNVGVEYLRISPGGWVSGSNCNNAHLGNLWNGSLNLPTGPQICKMQACVNSSDQLITKFV